MTMRYTNPRTFLLYLERSLLVLVTSALDLPLHTIKFCSVVFGVASVKTDDV